jgi:DNA polymerase III subunit delta
MILFLYGNDIFRSNEKLDALKKDFLTKNTSNANSSVFDFGEKNSFEELRSLLATEGLFSSKKLVIVKNIIDSSDKMVQDKMFDYLDGDKLSNDTTLVFWEKNEPRKNNKLFKLLINKAKGENLEKLSGVNLVTWIKKEFEDSGINIDNQALNQLVIFVGDDLFQMKNEVNKLINFSKGGSINKEDIDLIVKSKTEANIFETIEAMGTRNKKKALELFYNQLDQGDDPFYIMSMYIYQFRNLLKIGSFYFDGIGDKNIIAKETKLHPFVVQKGLQQLSNFSLQKLKNIHKQLEKLDINIKTGKTDIILGLDKFVIENC